MKDDWRIWEINPEVEETLYKRATGELPEMETTKQLVSLVKEIYVSGMNILDVGCGPGHYYRALKRVDKYIRYVGLDATLLYIEFARKTFPESIFHNLDIFAIPQSIGEFDIIFCCNLILHLPDFRKPLENMLNRCKKYCIIRTLVSNTNSMHKFYYDNEREKFVYQNTYSYATIRNYLNFLPGKFEVEFVKDIFKPENIEVKVGNKGGTQIIDGKQVVDNLIMDWGWIKITKI